MAVQSSMFIRTPHDPLVIDRAEGPWLFTNDGRRILDAGAGAVVVNIGQGREELAQVAAEEVARLNYIVPVWSSAVRMAIRFLYFSPKNNFAESVSGFNTTSVVLSRSS